MENHCSDIPQVGRSNLCYGVPQNSVVDPLSFLIYVNDIFRAVPKAKVKLYADVFLFGSRNIGSRNLNSEANLCLQEELGICFKTNKLTLYLGKTCYICLMYAIDCINVTIKQLIQQIYRKFIIVNIFVFILMIS